jgi:hypothetical protein
MKSNFEDILSDQSFHFDAQQRALLKRAASMVDPKIYMGKKDDTDPMRIALSQVETEVYKSFSHEQILSFALMVRPGKWGFEPAALMPNFIEKKDRFARYILDHLQVAAQVSCDCTANSVQGNAWCQFTGFGPACFNAYTCIPTGSGCGFWGNQPCDGQCGERG